MPKGGRREGAGRKRPDGRKWHVVKMPLTPAEFEQIKEIPPDQRREILLQAHSQKQPPN